MTNLVHLICDLKCEGLGRIEPASYLRFTDDLVAFLELKVINRYWQVFSNGSKFGLGISVLILLSESHLALHTSPEKKLLNLDIFSCHPFDEDMVNKMVRQMFNPVTYLQWKLISR